MLRLLLALLGFTAFLTGTKLVPVRHNVGPFEIVFALALVFVVAYGLAHGWRPRFQAISILAMVLVGVAAASLMKVSPPQFAQAIESFAVLAFLVVVLLLLHNVGLMFLRELPSFVRTVSWAGVAVGAWVVITSNRAGWSIEAYGPFRNRAHMGIYLLTVFWIIVLALAWPGGARAQRLALAVSLPLVLFGIAASGRRSVYLSLFLGLAMLMAMLWAAGRRRRFIVAVVITVSAIFLVALLSVGEDVAQQTDFFRARVLQVVPRLRAVLGSEAENTDPMNALLFQQRAGALQAFSDNPILGIGFGAFAGSGYPGSRYEMHSTPLRFLAETGIIGITAYAAFIAVLLLTSLRVARRAWDTPFRGFAMVFAAAWWSLAVSYGYNRHTNERTFWLLLAIFLVFEAYLDQWLRGRSQFVASLRGDAAAATRRLRSTSARLPSRAETLVAESQARSGPPLTGVVAGDS